MQTKSIETGYSPDSAYATWTKAMRTASDRMELAYNNERSHDVHRILSEKGVCTTARFTPVTGLHALAKVCRREVEDIEDGTLSDNAKGGRLRLAKARLNDVERELEFRQVLSETWQASDDGTHCYSSFMGRGGLGAVVNHGAWRPSFALAVFLDHTNHLEGRPTVFDWARETAA